MSASTSNSRGAWASAAQQQLHQFRGPNRLVSHARTHEGQNTEGSRLKGLSIEDLKKELEKERSKQRQQGLVDANEGDASQRRLSADANGGERLGGTPAQEKRNRCKGLSNADLKKKIEKEKNKQRSKSVETSVATGTSQGRLFADTPLGGTVAKTKGNGYKKLSLAELAKMVEKERKLQQLMQQQKSVTSDARKIMEEQTPDTNGTDKKANGAEKKEGQNETEPKKKGTRYKGLSTAELERMVQEERAKIRSIAEAKQVATNGIAVVNKNSGLDIQRNSLNAVSLETQKELADTGNSNINSTEEESNTKKETCGRKSLCAPLDPQAAQEVAELREKIQQSLKSQNELAQRQQGYQQQHMPCDNTMDKREERPVSCETNEAKEQQMQSRRRDSTDQQEQVAPSRTMASGEQSKRSKSKNRLSGLSVKELERLMEEEKQKEMNNTVNKNQKVSTEEVNTSKGDEVNPNSSGNQAQDPGSEGKKESLVPKPTKTRRTRKKKEVVLDPQAAREEAELRMKIQQSLQNQFVERATVEDACRVTIDTGKRLEQEHGFVENSQTSTNEASDQVVPIFHRVSMETVGVDDANSVDCHSMGDTSASFNSMMDESFASLDQDADFEEVPLKVSKIELEEWILLQKIHATDDVAEKKQYFEKALCILNSLVLKMIVAVEKDGDIDMLVDLDPKLITVENIMVVNEDNAYFMRTESLDTGIDTVEMKYGAMKALGVLTYELLMRGDGPQMSSTTTTDSEGIRLLSLCIAEDEMKADDKPDNIIQPKRQRALNGNAGGITAVMSNAGVPFPLIRFTLDLLGGESSDGLLFRSDDSFQSFSDIVMEIEQMMDNPEAFIHLSAKDQWRLAFGQKLHGREAEKEMIMAVAAKITTGLPLSNRQQVILVAGRPGSGKSRLVFDTLHDLEAQGWMALTCKFDRIVHAKPLSVMAHAFNEFFETSCRRNSQSHSIRTQIETIMNSDDVLRLAKHIPHLLNYLQDPMLLADDFEEGNKDQSHRLFRQLLKALSTTTPVVFFMDDLQWADATSADLILSLTSPDLSGNGCSSSSSARVLFIGSFRDNDADASQELTQMLAQLKSSAEVTDISVRGFDSDTLNEVVSESLCLPMRRTKALSEIILAKTDGVAIHIIEFIARLTTERMLHHSFVKGWEWDSHVIEGCPISDSVAELLSYKLKNLPHDVLLGLQICSVFGIQIEQRIIDFIQDFDGEETVDMNAGLKAVLELGLMEMSTNNAFKFSHDLLAESAFDLIEEDERSQLLQKLASSLIKNATAANEFESVIYVAVDLINRITNDAVTDPEERILYATMNEEAGRKALSVPDFSSAMKYSESGLAFLNADHYWESHHKLMLSIFQTSVTALYGTSSNPDLLQERISTVCHQALSLEEEFQCRNIEIQMIGKTSTDEVISLCHALLDRLGVSFANTSPASVFPELMRVNNTISPQELLALPRMVDQNMLNAMKVLEQLATYYYRQKSHMNALVSIRLIDISTEYGFTEETVFGCAAYAALLVTICGEVEQGGIWGRITLSLASKARQNVNALLSGTYALVYGFVLGMCGPIQATTEPLFKGCFLCFDYGNHIMALGNAHMYAIRTLYSGMNIETGLSELKMLAQKCGQYGQHHFTNSVLTPIYNVLAGLNGLDEQSFIDSAPFQADNLYSELQVALEIISSFIFRQMERTQHAANWFFEKGDKRRLEYTLKIIDLFAGLTACYTVRETGDGSLMTEVQGVLDRFEQLNKRSKWNFENKWLLLRAEYHHTKGETGKAMKCYEASICSAREHKFIHEEAIACELAGYFFHEMGNQTKSKEMFEQAHGAYMTWGAVQKARTMDLG